MVQRLAPHLGSLDEDLQVPLGLLLSDVLPESLGAQRALVLVLPGEGGGDKGLLRLKAGVRKVDAQCCVSFLSG